MFTNVVVEAVLNLLVHVVTTIAIPIHVNMVHVNRTHFLQPVSSTSVIEYCQYRSCGYLTCHNQGIATYNSNTNQCECSCPIGISGNHCEITPCNPYES